MFQKFINEYRCHFDEYGFSASWSTLQSSLKKISDPGLLIQTTPDILYKIVIKPKKINPLRNLKVM